MTSQYTGRILSGKYELLEQIGAGGMGVVYKALNTQLGITVCVKLLQQHVFDSAESVRRLQREAQALGALEHPNILRVFAFDSDDNQFFLVTEFIDGKSLSEILEQGKLEPELAKAIFTQIADALDYAHSRQIIHRDLKPSNILITQTGTGEVAKILDFGLARVLDDEKFQRMTRTGMLLGTPQYMSPEQCTGEPVGKASDIYSFGCMLYEALSGSPPFSGDSSMSLLYQHVGATVPRLPSSDLAEIAMRCLEKNAEDRFADCGDVSKAITHGYKPVAVEARKHRRKMPKVPLKFVVAAAVVAVTGIAAFSDAFKRPVRPVSSDGRGARLIFEELRKGENFQPFDAVADAFDKDLKELASRELEPTDKARLLHYRAVQSMGIGRQDNAERIYKEAIEAARKSNAMNGSALFDLAGLYHSQGRHSDRLRILQDEADFIENHPVTVNTHERLLLCGLLGDAYSAAGKPEQAIKTYKRFVAFQKPGSYEQSEATSKLARVLWTSPDAATKMRAFELLKAWLKENPLPQPVALAQNQNCLAELVMYSGDLQKAESLYLSVPRLLKAQPDRADLVAFLNIQALHGLAVLEISRQRPDVAEKYIELALPLVKSAPPSEKQALRNLLEVQREHASKVRLRQPSQPVSRPSDATR